MTHLLSLLRTIIVADRRAAVRPGRGFHAMLSAMDTAHGTVMVDAVTPDEVWRLVSDVTRTGEWSPENTGGRWRGGAVGPAVGARFQGSNRNGIFYWRTTAVVIAADVGRRFAFDVSAAGIPIARWDWTMSPASGGTAVSLDWTDRRAGPLGTAMRRGGLLFVGATIDRAHVQRNIDASLAQLRGNLSAGPPPGAVT
jgi:Polyketide cyclase / dehydrase and lipid transport